MGFFYTKVGKRLLDLALATGGLVALSPVMACVAVAVRARMGAPVLFKQRRAGLGARPFYIYKFRTMTDERDSNGKLLPDDQRLGRLGQFLRSTSLDELPELWNVVRGDMSLVGPRPLPDTYLQYYTEEENRRHDVLPGITGWAAVNGRNTRSWKERLGFDIYYVDNIGLLLDLQILLRTVGAVASREGVNLVEEFRGTSA